MLGAIIGDIAGSRFEGRHRNIKTKSFRFFTPDCHPTDDSVMTLAVGKAILASSADFSDLSAQCIKYMREIGCRYPHCGYGGKFKEWLFASNPVPYGSFGNGAAMRISVAGDAAYTIEDAKKIALIATDVSHNHAESRKAAEAVAVAGFMAKTGNSSAVIKAYIGANYYPMDFSLDEIRPTYEFTSSCQGSVPQALMAFFESTSFEDAIRNAISIGGDSDTIAAIAGGIAESYYGVPDEFRYAAIPYLYDDELEILEEFEKKYPPVKR